MLEFDRVVWEGMITNVGLYHVRVTVRGAHATAPGERNTAQIVVEYEMNGAWIKAGVGSSLHNEAVLTALASVVAAMDTFAERLFTPATKAAR